MGKYVEMDYNGEEIKVITIMAKNGKKYKNYEFKGKKVKLNIVAKVKDCKLVDGKLEFKKGAAKVSPVYWEGESKYSKGHYKNLEYNNEKIALQHVPGENRKIYRFKSQQVYLDIAEEYMVIPKVVNNEIICDPATTPKLVVKVRTYHDPTSLGNWKYQYYDDMKDQITEKTIKDDNGDSHVIRKWNGETVSLYKISQQEGIPEVVNGKIVFKQLSTPHEVTMVRFFEKGKDE